MLTLSPGSVCDVCAEEYNSHCAPLSIPCGHIFCWSCCHKIVQKTLPRLQAACPFCSEHFMSYDVHMICIKFSESGQATPGWQGGLTEALDRSPSRRDDRSPLVEPSFSHARAETRRLEDKVAKLVARKCSFEEVSSLYKELQEWLTHDENFHVQLDSLSSSAALLRIILMNHIAHSEAMRVAKRVEAALKGELDDLELKVSKLETDLKQQQALHTQKVQECQALRAELHFSSKSTFSRAANLPPRPSTTPPTGSSKRRRTVSSFAAFPYKVPATPSILSRFAATHSRSASASASGGSRPTTPAVPARMKAPSVRSETPTQASVLSSRLRATFPIPPSRPRTVSTTASQKTTRSHSDEREREWGRVHERWMPSPNMAYSPPTGKTINYPTYFGSSPASSRARAPLAAATLPRIITPIQPDDGWGLDGEWELDEDGLELDEDVLELDEDGSELDEDGSELDEDGSGPDEDESEPDEDGSEPDVDERRQEPIYERWMPSPDSMADSPIGKTVNYPPYFTSFPPPDRARASFSTNPAARLPQTIPPVQQNEDVWERGRIHERWMPSDSSNVPTGKTVNHSSYFGSSAPGLARPSFSKHAAAASPQTITPAHPDKHERGRKRIHERWMPSPNVASNPPTGKSMHCPAYFGSSSAPGRTQF